jgi:hypothetical protein
MRLDSSNFTNLGTSTCEVFKNKMARMEVVSQQIVHRDNVVLVEMEAVGKEC